MKNTPKSAFSMSNIRVSNDEKEYLSKGKCNHTPKPWHVDQIQLKDFRVTLNNGTIDVWSKLTFNGERISPEKAQSNAHRIVECVNACEGQDIETVKLATAHRNACMLFESMLMETVGEDGILSAKEAINKMKQDHEALKTELRNALESIANGYSFTRNSELFKKINDLIA